MTFFTGGLREIVKHSKENEKLMKCHSFVFNRPHPNADSKKIAFIVMGMNPGERADKLLQEKSSKLENRDFKEKFNLANGSTKRWICAIEEFCGKNVVQTEAFFWSSKNTKEHFKCRYDFSFKSEDCERHLRFCRDLNLKLINHYKPKAVILPGLGLINLVTKIYELKKLITVYDPQSNHRVLEIYKDKNNLPWIFTKHWTASRGLSKDQKKAIKACISCVESRTRPLFANFK